MGIERSLAGPGFEDGEVIASHAVLEDIEPKIAGFLSARLRKSQE